MEEVRSWSVLEVVRDRLFDLLKELLSRLSLVQKGPGEEFLVGEAFGIQRLFPEMKLFLYGLDQTSN